MSEWPVWRDIKDKPENIPGQYHSRTVILCMTDDRWAIERSFDEHASPFCLGHVSNGHWRPNGGNGNFDSRYKAWCELPELPQ